MVRLTNSKSLKALFKLKHHKISFQGEYQLAWALVNHGKERVSDSKWWVWSENVLYFIESYHKGQWQHAQLAINQLATVDKLESLIRYIFSEVNRKLLYLYLKANL